MTASANLAELTGDYELDPAHTRIGFVARHAMVTKVRGSFHEFQGHLHIDGSDPAKSRGEITIVANSIDTGVADRDVHLRSNDFFDMPRFPEIKFVCTDVRPIDATTYEVTGDLSIKGTTRPVTLNMEYTGSATDPFSNLRLGLEGSVVVNRKDWGVNWNATLEAGGVLVSDKVMIEIDVSAIRRSH